MLKEELKYAAYFCPGYFQIELFRSFHHHDIYLMELNDIFTVRITPNDRAVIC